MLSTARVASLYDSLPVLDRQYLVARCGWVTKKGFMTKTALRISNTCFKDLSPAAQNVIERRIKSEVI